MMENLINNWEKLADKYLDMAEKITNSYTQERLWASADSLKLCADQLRKHISDMCSIHNIIDREDKHENIVM